MMLSKVLKCTKINCVLHMCSLNSGFLYAIAKRLFKFPIPSLFVPLCKCAYNGHQQSSRNNRQVRMQALLTLEHPVALLCQEIFCEQLY